MIRQPAVAGYFYPGKRQELIRSLEGFVSSQGTKARAMAIVVPHAGYMYSGAVAGSVYSAIELPQRFIILCPNHTGAGSDFDVHPEGQWLTPMGSAEVDTEMCEQLLRLFPASVRDGEAHRREHSLEVQLPFLQYLKGDIRFLPVCIRQFRWNQLQDLANALVQIVKGSSEEILIIASSDMTHYESQESAGRKDRMAIDRMEKLDARGLYDTVHEHDISMCGYLPATVAMLAAKQLGATQGKLIQYATSGDVTHDYGSVVGYAGLIFG